MKNGQICLSHLLFPSIILFMIAGCGSGAARGVSGDLTITGTVSRPESAASLTASGLMILKGKHKMVDTPASSGTVTLIAEDGSECGTAPVQSDGTYSLKVSACDLQGTTAFVKVTSEDGESSENPINATAPIGSDATSITADVNSKSDFATALCLAAADEKTGETHQFGGDFSGAALKVDCDAVKNMTESVLGDDISAKTSLETTGTGLAAALEAHQELLASPPGDSATSPVDTLKEALAGDASAVSEYTSAAPTTGGGITTDATLFSACKEFSSTILSAYADKEDTSATEAYTEIKAAADSADDYKAYAGLMADTSPTDLAGLPPAGFRNCGVQIVDLGTEAFASDTKPRQTVIEQIKAGGCADAATAKLVMGAMGGCLPAAAADGTFDFSSFVPKNCAQAAMNLGFDLKNKIADPSLYKPGDFAACFAAKLRDPNAQQTCATTGTSGCGDFATNCANFTPGGTPPIFTGTIPQPPGGDCATSGVKCAPGTTCTTQSSGAKICAAVSGKLGQSCTTGADCDALTSCSRIGTCGTGFPTGAPVIGTTGGDATVGGTETGAPPPPPTSGTAGGLCSANSCATGSTCNGGVCVPSSVQAGAGASCTSNSQCTGGSCSGGVCQAATGTGAPAANGSACGNNTQCASSNCAGGVCQAAASPPPTSNGPCTSACPGGTTCSADSTCATGFCGGRTSSTGTGTCQVPGATVSGMYCRNTGDCGTSLTCSSNLCVAGSGASCTDNSSCASGSFCGGSPGARQCKVNGSGSNGDVCTASTQCSSSNCSGGTCQAQVVLAANGAVCTADSGCSSGYCGGTTGARQCKTSGANGDVCSANAQCSSSSCSSGTCQAANGASCTADSGCSSGYCGGTSGSRTCKALASGALSDICTANAQCGSGFSCTSAICQGPQMPASFSWTYPTLAVGPLPLTFEGQTAAPMTVQSQTATTFVLDGGSGEKTGNNFSFSVLGSGSGGACTYSFTRNQIGTISPLSCSTYTVTATRTSAAGTCDGVFTGGNGGTNSATAGVSCTTP